MIDSDKQRRWWFANHPEYSNSHKGKRNEHDNNGRSDQERVSPEAVDAYVDEALKYLDGPEAELLKSVKRNFGTEAESKRSGDKFAFLRDPSYQSYDDASASKRKDQDEPSFRDAVLKGIDNTLKDWQRWFGLSARLPPKEHRKEGRSKRLGQLVSAAREPRNCRILGLVAKVVEYGRKRSCKTFGKRVNFLRTRDGITILP